MCYNLRAVCLFFFIKECRGMRQGLSVHFAVALLPKCWVPTDRTEGCKYSPPPNKRPPTGREKYRSSVLLVACPLVWVVWIKELMYF